MLLIWVSATVTLAWSLRPMMFGATIATNRPRMTITTMISIRVKPLLRASALGCFMLIVSLILDPLFLVAFRKVFWLPCWPGGGPSSHQVTHVENRQHDRQNDNQHHRPHEQQHHGFK